MAFIGFPAGVSALYDTDGAPRLFPRDGERYGAADMEPVALLPPLDSTRFPPPALKALDAAAPAGLRLAASKGIVPGLKAPDTVALLVLLSEDADATIATSAAQTLDKLPAPMLKGALVAELQPRAAHELALRFATDADVVTALLRLPQVLAPTLEHLAAAADERCGELIATNEERMLAVPTVIEKLYLNKRVRMSTADRLIELAVRHGIKLNLPAFDELGEAIKEELIAEPSDEPTFDDQVYREAEVIAEQVELADDEDAVVLDEEGEEKVADKCLPLFAQINLMTVTQKIRMAMLGPSAARLILVRSSNRLVSEAAVKSPLLTENDAARIASSRQVSDAVLRHIAQNKDFARSYQIKMNLVQNPKTPFTFAARMIPHLRDSDLRNLARSKSVPGSVVTAVRQQMMRKNKG